MPLNVKNYEMKTLSARDTKLNLIAVHFLNANNFKFSESKVKVAMTSNVKNQA